MELAVSFVVLLLSLPLRILLQRCQTFLYLCHYTRQSGHLLFVFVVHISKRCYACGYGQEEDRDEDAEYLPRLATLFVAFHVKVRDGSHPIFR